MESVQAQFKIKRSQWQDHINQQKQSGLSQAEYCRRKHLDYDQFSYYKKTSYKKLEQKAQSTLDDFIPATIASGQATTSFIKFCISQPDGCTLSWEADWQPQQLAQFIANWRAS